ncbi:MAG TPA: YciI family protein [Jatrophihabitans sp.]|jgi:hypothetical protein|nr:YciI family protein [Jatrophihabitans sp.]
MPKFLVLIYEDEQKWIDEAEGTAEALAAHYKFNIDRADAIVAGKALQPTSTATSLRRDEAGQVQVTDGPFVETKEALGGFYLIEAEDVDQAVELAKQVPAPFGGHEVRPVQVFS